MLIVHRHTVDTESDKEDPSLQSITPKQMNCHKTTANWYWTLPLLNKRYVIRQISVCSTKHGNWASGLLMRFMLTVLSLGQRSLAPIVRSPGKLISVLPSRNILPTPSAVRRSGNNCSTCVEIWGISKPCWRHTPWFAFAVTQLVDAPILGVASPLSPAIWNV